MARPLLDDMLWNDVQTLLPPPKPRRSRYPGRKPIDDRKALTGILFVLKMGIPWEELPQEMGCGSGMTCWRRLQHWHQTGAWPRLQQLLTTQWREAERVDWSRAARESAAASFARENAIQAFGINDRNLMDRNGMAAVMAQPSEDSFRGYDLDLPAPEPLDLGGSQLMAAHSM
jgi:transposase